MSTHDDPTILPDSPDAVIAAHMLAVEAGDIPNRQEMLEQHLEHAEALQAFFGDLDRMDRVASPLYLADGPDATHAGTFGYIWSHPQISLGALGWPRTLRSSAQ